MPKFMLAYHGGGMPETPEEGAQMMAAWGAWMESVGASLVDPGNPVGMSKTVDADGVHDNGGSNPLSGYTIVEASDIDAAIAMAKTNPQISNNGSVEVAPIVEM